MNRYFGGKGLRVAALALVLSLVTARSASTALDAAPSSDAQSFSYSISRNSPSADIGLDPADILGVGGVLLIACPNLGLICTDPGTGLRDDLVALTYGQDFDGNGVPPVVFSVDAAAQGKTGTAVRAEATCQPAEARADAFQTTVDGANGQELDGDGVACTANSGFGLALSETSSGDDVDALGRNPCDVVDTNCDGIPDEPVYFTLGPQSPTLAQIGATPADILVTAFGDVPEIWLAGSALGLRGGDVVDGLCLKTAGDASSADNRLLFSLAPGSPSLAAAGANPGDLLRAPVRLAIRSAKLGLADGDNIDGLLCGNDLLFSDLFLPIINRQ